MLLFELPLLELLVLELLLLEELLLVSLWFSSDVLSVVSFVVVSSPTSASFSLSVTVTTVLTLIMIESFSVSKGTSIFSSFTNVCSFSLSNVIV